MSSDSPGAAPGSTYSSQTDDQYEFVAEFYDHTVPYRERGDVALWVEMAQRSGGPVLELGCGTGRVLIPTARAGIEIVGLDSSELWTSLSTMRGQVLYCRMVEEWFDAAELSREMWSSRSRTSS